MESAFAFIYLLFIFYCVVYIHIVSFIVTVMNHKLCNSQLLDIANPLIVFLIMWTGGVWQLFGTEGATEV